MEAITYFYDVDNEEVDKRGCCSFLSGETEDRYIIIPKNMLYSNIDEDYVDKWMSILNKCHLKSSITTFNDKRNEIITNYFMTTSEKQVVYGLDAIMDIADEIESVSRKNAITGVGSYYSVTDENMIDATILNDEYLYRLIHSYFFNKSTKAEYIYISNFKFRFDRGNDLNYAHDVKPQYFSIAINGEELNLLDYIHTTIDEYKKANKINDIKEPEKISDEFLIVKMDKNDYLTKINPLSINSAIRMLYLSRYEPMVKTAIDLYNSGFSEWDSLYLSHITKSSKAPYDDYYGLFSGISYYQTLSQLEERINNNPHNTNNAFTRYSGVANYDRNKIDTYLVNNDYVGLLEYMKKVSIGDDQAIGSYMKYNSSTTEFLTNGRYYEILESKYLGFKIKDNFFNERFVNKNKFN
jgi:hypothetical protein